MLHILLSKKRQNMKNIFRYIFAVSFIGGILSSCSLKEDMFFPSENGNSTTLVVAHISDFSRHDVTTKATADEENRVNELTMLVFGEVAANQSWKLITTPLYVEGEKLNFVINTTLGTSGNEGQYITNIQSSEKHSFAGFNGNLAKCRVYIAANMNTLLKEKLTSNSTENDFLNISYQFLANAPELGAEYSIVTSVPTGGFPMIGSADADLSPNSTLGSGSQQALTISLKKLFAKINFKFLVQIPIENNPDHMSMVQIPHFEPINWSVRNIPTNLTLREDEAEYVPTDKVFNTQDFNVFRFSTENSQAHKRIENSDTGEEYFEFSFYMPEYKVLSRNSAPSVDEVEEKFLQGYKPTLCGSDQKPTYVHVKGKFSDHQGQITEVEYDLYLGQNEVDNFEILRNQELNNIATITGITNHKDGEGVSLDHRVLINSSGYSIAMERETLLDCHFEFRRMDVSVEEGAVVVVKIPTEYQWFGAENADVISQSGADLSLYDSARPGLRKYFTPNLIAEIGGTREFVLKGPAKNNNGTTESTKHRIWFYFDENVDRPYDRTLPNSETNQLYREGKVKVDFYNNVSTYQNHGEPTQKDKEYTFRQMNLWRINGHLGHNYNIEYFEEYLYNYASDDNYFITTDGMQWGLNNEQLSTQYQALYASPDDMGGIAELFGNQSNFYTNLFEKIDARYDFYLQRDFPDNADSDVVKFRDYSGLSFTHEITNQTGIEKKSIRLSENAASAVEYCYNKNKRNDDGEVEILNWYLPAIDETEEILVDGFNYFPVFQSKWYWSSQPSYDRYNYTASSFAGSWISSVNGYYYRDDLDRARATRVTESQKSAMSGVTGAVGKRDIKVSLLGGSITNAGTEQSAGETITYDDGNFKRTAINRVRCVYDPVGVTLTNRITSGANVSGWENVELN